MTKITDSKHSVFFIVYLDMIDLRFSICQRCRRNLISQPNSHTLCFIPFHASLPSLVQIGQLYHIGRIGSKSTSNKYGYPNFGTLYKFFLLVAFALKLFFKYTQNEQF